MGTLAHTAPFCPHPHKHLRTSKQDSPWEGTGPRNGLGSDQGPGCMRCALIGACDLRGGGGPLSPRVSQRQEVEVDPKTGDPRQGQV